MYVTWGKNDCPNFFFSFFKNTNSHYVRQIDNRQKIPPDNFSFVNKSLANLWLVLESTLVRQWHPTKESNFYLRTAKRIGHFSLRRTVADSVVGFFLSNLLINLYPLHFRSRDYYYTYISRNLRSWKPTCDADLEIAPWVVDEPFPWSTGESLTVDVVSVCWSVRDCVGTAW